MNVIRILLLTGALTALLPQAMAAENARNDQLVSDNARDEARFHELISSCLDCHAIDDNSAGYVGPTLKGIVGRRAASVNSYGYSGAFYRKAAVGLIWDEAALDRFLESPQSMAPGNAMTYDGIPDADERAQLIAWLASGPQPVTADALASTASQPVSEEVTAIMQIKADIEYGEYLAGNCLTCHSAPGALGSVPPIAGLPASYFINALLEYQQGKRSNSVMQTMSLPLGTKELAALSAFFTQSAR